MRSLFIIILGLFFITGCMPDSFTKYKEDPPTKDNEDAGSTDGTTTDSDGNTVSLITPSGGFYPQIAGQDWILKLISVGNISSFTSGDKLSASTSLIADSDTQKGVASILSAISDDTQEGGEAGFLKIQIASSNITSAQFSSDYYVDNCDDGSGVNDNDYGSISATCNSSAANQVDEVFRSFGEGSTVSDQPIFFIDDIAYTGSSIPSDWVFTSSVESVVYTDGSTLNDLERIPLGFYISPTDGTITVPQVPFTAPTDIAFINFEVTVTNGGGETYSFFHNLASTADTISSNTLTYDYAFGERLVFEVDSASSFSAGQIIYSCGSSIYINCDTAGERSGIATIYWVDTEENLIFATVSDAVEKTFSLDNYLHKDGGGAFTQVIARPHRLHNTDDTTIYNATLSPALASAVYSVTPNLPSGISLDAITGQITLSGSISTSENNTYQVSVVDSTSGELKANYPLRLSVLDPPSLLSYSLSELSVSIGNAFSSIDPTISGLSTVFTKVFYNEPVPLPSGVILDQSIGIIYGNVNEYVAGVDYVIEGFHPYSGVNAFDSFTLNISSASRLTQIYPTQQVNDQLLLRVSDASAFIIGETISNTVGMSATVLYVDYELNELYVSVITNSNGSSLFADEDNIDDRASFVSSETTVLELVHVFDSATAFSDVTFKVYNEGGIVDLASGETVDYGMNPDPPASMSFGLLDGVLSDEDGVVGLLTSSEENYIVSATGVTGDTATYNYRMAITELPKSSSLASLQFLHIDGVANNRFYIGTRFQTEDGVNGKIIDLFEDSDNLIKGLLVQANGSIPPGAGIDNTVIYFAPETHVVNKSILEVSDLTAFSVNDDVISTDQIKSQVISTWTGLDSSSTVNRMLVEVEGSGSFNAGTSIDDSTVYSNSEAIINNVFSNNFVNFVLALDDTSGFSVGGYISGNTNNGLGLIIFNDMINNKLYVRALSRDIGGGTYDYGAFSESEDVDSAYTFTSTVATVQEVLSPYLELTLSATDADLFAGKELTAESGAVFQASGQILSDDNTTDNKIYIERFFGTFEEGDSLDDTNPFVATEQTITDLVNDNSIYLYVGNSYFIDTFVRGSFNSVSVTPDLPNGLSLDSETASISGTPIEPIAKQEYTISIRNGSNIIENKFNIAVYNQFYLYDQTTTTNRVSSYYMHKQGQGNRATECRVNSLQVDDSSTSVAGVNDINCILDVAENDLYSEGVSLFNRVGGGLCEYITYQPYAYQALPAKNTNNTFYNFSFSDPLATPENCNPLNTTGDGFGSEWTITDPDSNGVYEATDVPSVSGLDLGWDSDYCTSGDTCRASGSPSDIACSYDYEDLSDFSNTISEGKNCDEGSIRIVSISCEADAGIVAGVCSCTRSVSVLDCAGENNDCVSGAALNLDNKRSSGKIITQLNSYDGLFTGNPAGSAESNYDLSSDLDTPIADSSSEVAARSNTRHANYMTQNSCIDADEYQYDMISYNNYNLDQSEHSPLFGNNAYVFTCLDSAGDPRARIHLLLREWNTGFNPSDSIDKMTDDTAKADTSAATCFGESCDQYRDLDGADDDLTIATFDMSFPSCGGNAATVDVATDAVLVRGSYRVSSVIGGFLTSLAAGSPVEIGGVKYVIIQVLSDNEAILSSISDQSLTGQTITVTRGVLFPLE